MAQTMTKEQFKSTKDGIAAQYKAAKASRTNLSGNAKDICGAEEAKSHCMNEAKAKFNKS